VGIAKPSAEEGAHAEAMRADRAGRVSPIAADGTQDNFRGAQIISVRGAGMREAMIGSGHGQRDG
jgi:hypothetical protein